MEDLVKVGPVGGIIKGTVWDHKGRNKISHIFISHGDRINSIQFRYADDNGFKSLSERLGSNHGNIFEVVKLNYDADECITSIGGRMNNGQICSIKFQTNRREYAFGKFNPVGEEFRFSLGDFQFGGFHGTTDANGPKSIGIYMKPIETLYCHVLRTYREVDDNVNHELNDLV